MFLAKKLISALILPPAGPGGETMKEVAERDFGGKVKWVEAKSADTAENALYSARMLGAENVRRIALVSQAWHLPRAVALFEAQGIEVVAAPTGFTTHPPSAFAQALPSVGALEDSTMAVREWLGRVVARLAAR